MGSTRNQLLFFLIIVLLNFTESNRKSRKSNRVASQLPRYEIFPSDQLPSDIQVTTFLNKEKPKKFFYWSAVNNSSLSATVITCSSPVKWTLKYIQNNSTVNVSDKKFEELTNDTSTKFFVAFNGLYALQLIATQQNTFVHIYMSTEKDGPQALINANQQRLKLFKKQKRGSLSVRWEPSLVDPQGTDYCLVINTKKNYTTLCSAEAGFHTVASKFDKKLRASSQTIISWQPDSKSSSSANEASPYPQIACVGDKTHFTASHLNKDHYYFNLFAINKQSNLTYLFGSTDTNFDKRSKPILLKDGKSSFANLKKLDGKAVFRFKIGKRPGKSLNIYVMPCGNLVYMEIMLKNQLIIPRKRIERFDKITIANPMAGEGYRIKIFTTSNILNNAAGVEIFATTKSSSKIPLPNMPSQTTVIEYDSLRRCDSVTIGWLPSPGQEVAHYCLVITEGKIKETEEYITPNQCGLENRLKKSVDFVLKYCKDKRQDMQRVITEKIGQLKPRKSYIVQVTVKKPRGKTLSYDLLQVHTLSSCHKKLF